MIKHLAHILFHPKIGPDMYFTHWLLFFEPFRSWYQKRMLGFIGEGSEIRPYAVIIGSKNVYIGSNVIVPEGTVIVALPGDKDSQVIVGDNVLLGPRVAIYATTHKFDDISMPVKNQGNSSGKTVIKSGSWIGINSVILSGVTVGVNSVVGANSVVTRDVPDFCVYAGSPAKFIRKLN